MSNTSSGASQAKNFSRRNDIFYYRRKSPLVTANLTEEEVKIQKHRTYRRRRSNDFKLNSPHLFSKLPDLFELTTIRTTHTSSTSLNKINSTTLTLVNWLLNMNTVMKKTKLPNPITSVTENIHLKDLKTMTLLTRKNYTNEMLGKEMEFTRSRYYYSKNKDEFRKTDQTQKQLYFLNP